MTSGIETLIDWPTLVVLRLADGLGLAFCGEDDGWWYGDIESMNASSDIQTRDEAVQAATTLLTKKHDPRKYLDAKIERTIYANKLIVLQLHQGVVGIEKQGMWHIVSPPLLAEKWQGRMNYDETAEDYARRWLIDLELHEIDESEKSQKSP